MGVSYPVKLALFALSNNICGFRTCDNKIVIPDYDLNGGSPHKGEAAHIRGEKEGAPRYDSDYPKNKVNSLENLILLCSDCHTKIDKNPEKYSVEMLLEMKKEHEHDALFMNISKVSFSELDVAAQAIAVSTDEQKFDNDFDLIKLDKKINLNNLTDSIKDLLHDALSKSRAVEEYLSTQAKLNPNFPNNLIDGFKKQYQIFSEEFSGDILFYKMKIWAERDINYGNNNDILAVHAASFVILCHLFEKCEIFEK